MGAEELVALGLSLSLSSEHTSKAAACTPGSRLSPWTASTSTLTLDLYPPELREIKVCFLKPPILWHFVFAAQAKTLCWQSEWIVEKVSKVPKSELAYCCCSGAQSCPALCNPMDCGTPGFPVHHQLLELTQTHVHSNSSSVVPFSSYPQSLPASGTFEMSQFFASGGQSIGASASASVLPMNIQDWSPLGWTTLTSLQSKGLSRVFSNTTVQKHQSFSTQLSLWSNSHIHTWLLEKP